MPDRPADVAPSRKVGRALPLVTPARPGFELPDLRDPARLIAPNDLARIVKYTLETPRIDISASQVRARLSQGLSIRYLVPDAVTDYIVRSPELRCCYGVA